MRRGMIVLMSVWPTLLAAQTPDSIGVRGVLVDVATALPLPRVQVVITRQADTVARTTTDSLGMFRGPGVRGERLTAHFRRLGYIAGSVDFIVDDMPLRLAMNSTVTTATLAPITVQKRAFMSFERRMARTASGTFISPARIAQRKAQNTSELLRTLPGVKMVDSLGVIYLYSNRSTRSRPPNAAGAAVDQFGVAADAPIQPTTFENCPMRVRIDGLMQPPDFSINDIRPADIHGIEVYNSALGIPPEFITSHAEGACGLIAIWTKRGRERTRDS
jgi:hypothetical protein